MKILHICTTDEGGAGLCCMRIHESLLQQGLDSKVLVLSKNKQINKVFEYGHLKNWIWRAFNKSLRLAGLEITDYNRVINLTLKSGYCYSVPRSVLDVSKHPYVKEADIIHLHWIDNFIDYPTFFPRVNKPLVWTLHDENLFLGIAHYSKEVIPNNPLEKKYYLEKISSLKKTKKIGFVFLSEQMYNEFSNNEIIKDREKIVIHNSVDYAQFYPIDKFQARKRLGIPSNALVFVFVSVNINDPRKGLNILSEALQKMNIPNAFILAIGNIPDGFKLPLTHCIGVVNDPKKLSEAYSCADYFVMPSNQEAFAQTPLEAMSCGTPAIVFPVSGTKELISVKNGIRTTGFTVNDLITGINKAMNTSYNHNDIRADIIQRFSPKHISEQYINFYNRMLSF